jgi:hypothetical protein
LSKITFPKYYFISCVYYSGCANIHVGNIAADIQENDIYVLSVTGKDPGLQHQERRVSCLYELSNTVLASGIANIHLCFWVYNVNIILILTFL